MKKRTRVVETWDGAADELSSVKALVNENRTESDWRAASPTQSDSRNWSPIVSQLAHLLRDFEDFYVIWHALFPTRALKIQNYVFERKSSKTMHSLAFTVAFCQECAPARYTVAGSLPRDWFCFNFRVMARFLLFLVF